MTDGWVFASGQIPIDPATGALVGGDIRVQAGQALMNLAAVLAAAGGSLRTVVKATGYLSDMALFADMNAVSAERSAPGRCDVPRSPRPWLSAGCPPAPGGATIPLARRIPMTEDAGAMTEIAAVRTDRAPAAIGPYSQAVVAGGRIFSSGQIPIDPATGAIAGGSVEEQTELVLANLAAVLEEAGGGLGTVVKTTVYLSDMASFGEMNAVYAKHFGDHRPARSTVAVAALPKGVDIEIDAVAMVA